MTFETQTFKNIFFDHTATAYDSYKKAPMHQLLWYKSVRRMR